MASKKKFPKNTENKNLFWIIIGFIIVVIILAVYFSQLATKKAADLLAIRRRNEVEDRVNELHKSSDIIQKQRMANRIDIVYYNTMKKWAAAYINRLFTRLRWTLFISVGLLFTIAAVDKNFLGFTTDDLLKYISISVILMALFFFANSEENQSLATSFRRTKEKAVDYSVVLIKNYYRRFKKVTVDLDLYVTRENNLYKQLVPVMNELRSLKNQI